MIKAIKNILRERQINKIASQIINDKYGVSYDPAMSWDEAIEIAKEKLEIRELLSQFN